MKSNNCLFILCLSILFIQGCSSGKSALNKGNYYEATITAVERLRSTPENKKTQDVLADAYPLALSELQRNIKNIQNGNGTDKYAAIFLNYQQLNNMADQIYKCPAALKIISSPQEFRDEESKYRTLAAEETYLMGIKRLNEGNRNSAKSAYYHFADVEKYIPNYKDIKEKQEEALYYATFRVIIEKQPIPSRYRFSADYFFNNIASEVVYSLRNNIFVDICSQTEAFNYDLPVNQIVVLEFDDFTIGNIRETSDTKEYKKEVQIRDESGKDQAVRNKTFKAEYTRHTREIISTATLSVRIIDPATNKIIEHRRFSGRYVWNSSWATYRGDADALTDAQLKEARKKPGIPPANEDMFIEATKSIFNDATAYLSSYYRKF